MTGGLLLDLLEIEGDAVKPGASAKRGRPLRRKEGKARAKAARGRKVERRRRG